MDTLFQSGKYGSISTAGITTNKFYVIKFILEAYTLQNNTPIGGKIISTGGLGVKEQYILSMQEKLIGIGNNNHCNRIP